LYFDIYYQNTIIISIILIFYHVEPGKHRQKAVKLSKNGLFCGVFDSPQFAKDSPPGRRHLVLCDWAVY